MTEQEVTRESSQVEDNYKPGPNTKKIDYLSEDDPISGQKWTCVSFLCPERVHNCKIRGLKVRGVFASEEDANEHADYLRKVDPNFDVFVGEVGKWVPWDPDVNDKTQVKDQSYYENELQTMAKAQGEQRKKVKEQEVDRKQKMLDEGHKASHSERKQTTVDRMRAKLQKKRAEEEFHHMTTNLQGKTDVKKTGKKKRNRKKTESKTKVEMDSLQELVNDDKELSKSERERLRDNEKVINKKEVKVSTIKDKLAKIESLYTKLNETNATNNS